RCPRSPWGREIITGDGCGVLQGCCYFGPSSPTLHPRNVWLTSSCHIQGVVHVTTHRFTFHATLLSSQPGYSQKIVKSGTALIHRKGLHRKKRVWLQLDHDMVSSF